MVVFYTKTFDILKGLAYPEKKYDSKFINDLEALPNLTLYKHCGLVVSLERDFIWSVEAIGENVRLFRRRKVRQMSIKIHPEENTKYLNHTFSNDWPTVVDWLDITYVRRPITLLHKDGTLFFWNKLKDVKYPNPFYSTHLIVKAYERVGIPLTYNYENKYVSELNMEFINYKKEE